MASWLPHPPQPLLRRNPFSWGCPFQTQTHQSWAHIQPSLLLGSHTLGYYTPALITLGPDIRQLETVPMSKSLLESFKPVHPKHAYPALPVAPCGNHNEDSCPPSPHPFPLPPANPRATQYGSPWRDVSPPSGTSETISSKAVIFLIYRPSGHPIFYSFTAF